MANLTAEDKVRLRDYSEWIKQNESKKTSSNPKDVDDFNKVSQSYNALRDKMEQPFQFNKAEMVKNIPSSFNNEMKNLIYAITDPVNTGASLINLGKGIVQKFIPGVQDEEKYANALGQHFSQRYGSKEKILETLQNDPVGFLGDASMFLTGGSTLVGKTASVANKLKVPGSSKIADAAKKVSQVGASFDPLNLSIKTGTGVSANLLSSNVPRKLYDSAAKWGSTLDPEKRAKITEIALKNQLDLSIKGLDKFKGKIKKLGSKIDSLIKDATKSGKTIDSDVLFKYMDDLRKEMGGVTLTSAEDLADINKIANNLRLTIKRNKSKMMTPQQMQDLKTKAYKDIDFDRSQQKSSLAKEEAYKAASRSAKEALEEAIPGLKEANAEFGELKQIQKPFERAVGRIENRDIIGLSDPTKVIAGAQVGGNAGAGLGFLGAMFERNKGRLAQSIYNKQNRPISDLLNVSPNLTLLQQLAREDEQYTNTQNPYGFGLLSPIQDLTR